MSDKTISQNSERNVHPLLTEVERLLVYPKFYKSKPTQVLELLKQFLKKGKIQKLVGGLLHITFKNIGLYLIFHKHNYTQNLQINQD
jgi:hypothetical protein